MTSSGIPTADNRGLAGSACLIRLSFAFDPPVGSGQDRVVARYPRQTTPCYGCCAKLGPASIENARVGSAFALQPPEAKLDLRITPSFGDRFRQTRGCHGACRFAEATAGAHGSFTLPVPFLRSNQWPDWISAFRRWARRLGTLDGRPAGDDQVTRHQTQYCAAWRRSDMAWLIGCDWGTRAT